jgi:hypothetical protein
MTFLLPVTRCNEEANRKAKEAQALKKLEAKEQRRLKSQNKKKKTQEGEHVSTKQEGEKGERMNGGLGIEHTGCASGVPTAHPSAWQSRSRGRTATRWLPKFFLHAACRARWHGIYPPPPPGVPPGPGSKRSLVADSADLADVLTGCGCRELLLGGRTNTKARPSVFVRPNSVRACLVLRLYVLAPRGICFNKHGGPVARPYGVLRLRTSRPPPSTGSSSR